MVLREKFYFRPSTGMAMLIVLMVLGCCSTSKPHVYDPIHEIEYRYSTTGPYPVTRIAIPAAFNQPGRSAYLPDAHDGQAQLVIWQNGTGEPINTYDAIARHLASWGMVVIGSNDRQMGSGQRATGLLKDAQLWSATPDNPFFGRISANTFAFVGSSQGAVSSINAHTQFTEGRGAAALAIHGTPSQEAINFFGLSLSYDASTVTAPILILTGTEDEFISPVRLNQAIFNSLAVPGLRVLAVADGADHIELAHDAGRFRGYLTAWLAYHLLGHPEAAQAFIGRAEIDSNSTWSLTDVSR